MGKALLILTVFILNNHLISVVHAYLFGRERINFIWYPKGDDATSRCLLLLSDGVSQWLSFWIHLACPGTREHYLHSQNALG